MNANRIQSVDFFRVIAILAVIIIHTTPFSEIKKPIIYKYTFIVINQLARFAVPFFFVISGYFYGLKISNLNFDKYYTINRLKFFLFLWVAWSFIYILPYNLHSLFSYGGLGPIKIIYWNCLDLLSNPLKLLLEGSKAHLWFINALLWAVLICYLLRKHTNVLLMLSIALYLLGLLSKSYSCTQIGINIPFNTRNGPFFGTIFFVTGYLLSQKQIQYPLYVGFLCFIFGVFLHFCELFVLYKYYHISPLQDYVIGTYFMGIGVSLMALSNNQLFLKLSSINKIGPFVGGIYLIHIIFVDNFRFLKAQYSPISDIFYPIVVMIFSYYSVLMMSRNKYLKILCGLKG